MPNLIANHQKREAVTRLKKAYSVLSQAIVLAQDENGPISTWNLTSHIEGQSYGQDFLEYILPYFKGARIKSNIYATKYLYEKTRLPVNFKGDISIGVIDKYWIETADGMYIFVGHINWNNPTFFIQVDINGSKKPNISGKDIFYFMLTGNGNKKLVGYSGLSREEILKSNCCKTCSANGRGCATVIMQDGWEIKDDYPW